MSRSRCGGRVVRHVVDGDLGVQQIARKDGRHSRTIVWPEGTLHVGASRFLCLHDGSGTQRTYTYLLVDHLQWLERECRAFDVGNYGTANASTRPSPASAARRPRSASPPSPAARPSPTLSSTPTPRLQDCSHHCHGRGRRTPVSDAYRPERPKQGNLARTCAERRGCAQGHPHRDPRPADPRR